MHTYLSSWFLRQEPPWTAESSTATSKDEASWKITHAQVDYSVILQILVTYAYVNNIKNTKHSRTVSLACLKSAITSINFFQGKVT